MAALLRAARPALAVITLFLASAVIQIHLTGSFGRRDEGARIDRIPPAEILATLPPLPRRLAADILWIRALQSYGYHRQHDQNFHPLAAHFNAVTRVDPSFEMAYDFGGLVIAQEGEDPRAGIDLLSRGMSALPHSWLLPFETGFVYYVCLGDAMHAAHYFERSAGKNGAPPYVKHFAAFSNARAGRLDVARCFWQTIAQETDREAIRRLAQEALRRIDAEIEKENSRRSLSGSGPRRPGERA